MDVEAIGYVLLGIVSGFSGSTDVYTYASPLLRFAHLLMTPTLNGQSWPPFIGDNQRLGLTSIGEGFGYG